MSKFSPLGGKAFSSSLATLFILCMFATLAIPARAQFKEGDWEVGLNGSLGSLKITYTYESLDRPLTISRNASYFVLSLSPGFFVADGFSVEPEFGALYLQNAKPVHFLLGSFAYTYFFEEEHIAPFARVGAGLANGFLNPNSGTFAEQPSTALNIVVLHAGAGAKFVVGKSAEIKLELHYRRQQYKRPDEGFVAREQEIVYSNVGLSTGIAVLF